jgi:hypothetical protein
MNKPGAAGNRMHVVLTVPQKLAIGGLKVVKAAVCLQQHTTLDHPLSMI